MEGKGSEASLAGRVAGPGGHKLMVESDSFEGAIPAAFAGAHGRSPSLRWSAVPEDTREVVIIAEDPDAPQPTPFVHWIVTNIPPALTELSEGLPATAAPLAHGLQQGRNSTGGDGYFGPAPPKGHGVHHYHFQVFALDARVDVEAPIERDRLVAAMRDHVIAVGEIVGTYER